MADASSFLTTLNLSVVKGLMILRLRAIWDNNLISEVLETCATHYIDFPLDSSHTHSMYHYGRYVL